VIAGDALLDRDLNGQVQRLSPEGPVPVVDDPAERRRPGGAALGAALAAADGGRDVILVTALAADELGRCLADLLERAGVEVIDLGLDGPTPEKVRVRADGRTLLRLDHGGSAARVGPLTRAAAAALRGAAGVLVADYGRGLAAQGSLREALAGLPASVPVVWDPHPNGPEPVPRARLATPNQAEVAILAPGPGGRRTATDLAALTAGGSTLLRRWRAAAVAITLGSGGALLVEGATPPRVVPARPVPSGDVCGAGDRFASAAARLLADGALPSEAVVGAVAAASAFVAAGGAAAFDLLEPAPGGGISGSWTGAARAAGGREAGERGPATGIDAALAVIAAVRGRGGTVVATGGCFDLLHAGHVASLRAARALGDCLVVLLNSDSSVRQLKGPGRPLVPERDRAAVLSELGCVDAVVLFDETTPAAVLDRLRPDVFAKGGDYALARLPEAALLAAWGGQAVILPYLEGRSTTRLLQEASRRGYPADQPGDRAANGQARDDTRRLRHP
jgi:D-beta-D-heptose 7-phosphate kinase/D-beta-D-heptose 1-phosphate adenosyltransferase